ncbi:MAG: hypothetical protein MI861_03385, partial [Pirellulales bacterium]|nr:hypothetical protein [Pirellulales bacterium]
EGSLFVNLSRQPPLPLGTPKPVKEAARWVRRGGKLPAPIWRDDANRRFTSFVVTEDRLLATGHRDGDEQHPFLVSTNTTDGQDNWMEPIPANTVKGGTAIGHDGRLYLSLENGKLLCFEPNGNK